MNFSIHIDNQIVEALNHLVVQSGQTRNALINKAIRRLLEQEQRSKWPEEVRRLAGSLKGLRPFEDYRDELKPPTEEPLK